MSLTSVCAISFIQFNTTGTNIGSGGTSIQQDLQNPSEGATYQFSIEVGIINDGTKNPTFQIYVVDEDDGSQTVSLLQGQSDPCPNSACIPPGQTYGYRNLQTPYTVANSDLLTLQLSSGFQGSQTAFNPLLFDNVTLTLTALPPPS